MCKHLAEGEKRGFHTGYDPKQPHALYPDAWCDECAAVREKEGEWNAVSQKFAEIKMVCSGCYQEIREKNWLQDEEGWNELVQESFGYLKKRQDQFLEQFRIMEHAQWNWDQEAGLLTFSHEGKPQVEADISFSGTFSTTSGSWMWAWANDSLAEKIKSESLAMRALGEEKNYLKLASALWTAEEMSGWEMTAVMAKAFGAIGAYRTAGDDHVAYMIVKSARWLTD